ncbi:MAG: hypothetical protein A2451_07480 [Bdellovibrionales bacterium RIFOXYC2_FULL_39_8]|nr:MAG: hypothetical protein A2451_07480 [Bdellovibrionales bacterium RIFOXYC2_FULL_39_8]HLE12338.1 CopG family antitoxin [Bacteriovoracaceae bacterium]
MKKSTKKQSNVPDPLKGDMSEFIGKSKWVKASVLFEYLPKDKTISLRLSEPLLNEAKKKALKKKIDLQKLIREALIHYLEAA